MLCRLVLQTEKCHQFQVTVASQYFMTLAQYLRLPVVAWNADNSAQEQGGAHFQLQLAPTLKHQVSSLPHLFKVPYLAYSRKKRREKVTKKSPLRQHLHDLKMNDFVIVSHFCIKRPKPSCLSWTDTGGTHSQS